MKMQIAFHSGQIHGSLYTIILLFFNIPSFFVLFMMKFQQSVWFDLQM